MIFEVKQSVSENTAEKGARFKKFKMQLFGACLGERAANYAQTPRAHSSNPPAPLSRQRTKKTKETDKQTVSEKKSEKKIYKR